MRIHFVASAMDLVLALLNVLLLEFVLGTEWGYKGDVGSPSKWYHDYPVCDEKRQSPIDIVTDKATVDDDIRSLKFHGYDENLTGGTITNNGHTVVLQFPSDKTFTMSGGGFDPNRYRALQLHFHWSAVGSTEGSEHTIDGKRFPVEMHIVHIKEPYNTVEEVKGMSDGLAVLSIMFDIGPEGNMDLQKLLDAAENLKYAGSTATLTDGPQLEQLLPLSTTFYRYFGSLTTPPCYESVIWTIFSEPAYLSQSQLTTLQSLKSVEYGMIHGNSNMSHEGNTSNSILDKEDGLGGNFRPVQPLNGRVVIFAGNYEEPTAEGSMIIIIVLSCLCGLFAFIAMVMIVKRCCCKKRGKDTKAIYRAGRPEDSSFP